MVLNLARLELELKINSGKPTDQQPPTAISTEKFYIRLLNHCVHPEVRALRTKEGFESPQYFLQSGQNTSSTHRSSTQETKRKRRSKNWSAETSGLQQIKYRKVGNRFLKFISQIQEDDDFRFLSPSKYDKKLLLNRTVSDIRSKRNILEMSDGRALTSIDKSALRKKSVKKNAPEFDQKLIKNAVAVKYLDEKPSCSIASRSAPKVYNIPINHRSKERLKFQAKLAHLVPKLLPANRMSYADVCRQQVRGNMIGRQATGSSVCSSEASASNSVRVLNGLNHIPTTAWPSKYRSILTRERENEEGEKCKQLLEQGMPSTYDIEAHETKSNNQAGSRRKRSTMLVATANSSAVSSQSASTRPLGLPSMNFSRSPISSTINSNDDDDDDELTKAKVPTVVTDDVSDVIDLGNDDRHTVSARANIKQQDKPTYLGICKGYKEKPKNTDLPFVEPFNTLREQLNASPIFKDNWLENFKSKWSLRRKSRLNEIRQTNTTVEKFSAARRAAEIQERLRTFQIVDPEVLVIDDVEEPVGETELIELTQEHNTRLTVEWQKEGRI
uniref:Uncharacterized protein n=1 Tax=Glossina austeni TaxID=7395 RepID=A0A1A9VXV3_GLOAU